MLLYLSPPPKQYKLSKLLLRSLPPTQKNITSVDRLHPIPQIPQYLCQKLLRLILFNLAYSRLIQKIMKNRPNYLFAFQKFLLFCLSCRRLAFGPPIKSLSSRRASARLPIPAGTAKRCVNSASASSVGASTAQFLIPENLTKKILRFFCVVFLRQEAAGPQGHAVSAQE